MRILSAFAAALMWLAPTVSMSDVRLLMAEEQGCIYCARWNAEIADIYPKTPEGQAAPLVRYDLHAEEAPADLAVKVRFTPTFILVKDGVETGRIEGYPGEDFFWGLLGMLLEQAEVPFDDGQT